MSELDQQLQIRATGANIHRVNGVRHALRLTLSAYRGFPVPWYLMDVARAMRAARVFLMRA